MTNYDTICFQAIDMLLYRTWRDSNDLSEELPCYAWVVFYQLENSIYGLLFIFLTTYLTTFLTTMRMNLFNIFTIAYIDPFNTIYIELWQCQYKDIQLD